MFSPAQNKILHFLFEKERVADLGFFFSGGTALTEYYLRHRISEDLDLFTRRADLDFGIAFKNLSSVLSQFGETKTAVLSKGFARFFVKSDNGPWGNILKIEFVTDVPFSVAPPKKFGTIIVDSIEDIATNKVSAIIDRDQPRDAFDLYKILSDRHIDFEKLIFTWAPKKDANFENKEAFYILADKIESLSSLTQDEFLRSVRPTKNDCASDMASYLRDKIDHIFHKFSTKKEKSDRLKNE